MAGQALFHVHKKSLGLRFSLHCLQPASGNSFPCHCSMYPVKTSLTINAQEKLASVPNCLLTGALVICKSGLNSSCFGGGVLEFLAPFYSSVSNGSDEFSEVKWPSFSVHLCVHAHTGTHVSMCDCVQKYTSMCTHLCYGVPQTQEW